MPDPGRRATSHPTPPRLEAITSEEAKRRLLIELGRNRRVAHETLFAHRHPLKTPPFHLLMIDAFHGSHPKAILEAFRDAANSTVPQDPPLARPPSKAFRNCPLPRSPFAR